MPDTAVLWYSVIGVRLVGARGSDVVHVVTTTPVCLYSMNTSGQHMSCVDLCDVFPAGSKATRYQLHQPRLRLATLSAPLDTDVVIHDQLVCLCT